jgi:hypothetical protein
MMNKILLTMLIITISASAAGQPAFSSLEEQMNGKEFSAAGLEKLTPDELAALNQWIRSRSLATLDAGQPGTLGEGEDLRGLELQKMKDMPRTAIKSRVVGTFTGWDGQTTFRLENGMIWQQVDKDKFYIKAVKDPLVTIEPGMLKTWRLSVEGYSSDCRVKRIQ